MWKKYLAVMAIVGIMAAQTAVAGPIIPPDVTTPLKSLTVTPDTFNPGEGETVDITVEVNQPSLVTLELLSQNAVNPVVYTFYSSEVVQDSKTVTYAGVMGNGNVLNDGEYLLDAYVMPISRTASTDGTAKLTVVSTDVPAGVTVDTFETSAQTLDPTVEGSAITFSYTLSGTADVALVIYEVVADGDVVVKTFSADDSTTGSFVWDGTDDEGNLVLAGNYKAVLTAVPAEGSAATANSSFNVIYDGTGTADFMDDIEIDPNPWDPSDESLDIEFELTKDIDELTIVVEDSDGKELIELWEDEELEDGDDFEIEWDGMDEDDDPVEEGTIAIVFTADNAVYTHYVKVAYEDPKVMDDLFLTKTSFDNDLGEKTAVVFRTDADAYVDVEITEENGKKEVVTLVEEMEVNDDDWYVVEWDGMDDDGDEADYDTYKFKITAYNKSNDDVESSTTIEVVIEEDELSSKTNVTNDWMEPVIVAKDGSAVIEYVIDDDAEVTVEIFKGSKSSNAEVVLVDDKEQKAGKHTVAWDGRDSDGKKLDKDTKYSYRVTARTIGSSSKTDKERGYFVIGVAGTDKKDPVDPVDPPTPEEDCGFKDVSESSAYCEAIAWAKANDVVDGYPDGTFRQYDFINRAEALKVVLEAFNVSILPDDYTHLGFTDTIIGEWYMKYLRTGKFYGMVDGYGGTTLVKPEYEVNRVELLKYVLEAAEAINGYKVPVCNAKYYNDTEDGWYSDYVCLAHDYDLYNTYAGYFYPGEQVMRGEVALLLYRLDQAGLLK